jgi:hypothetical protein
MKMSKRYAPIGTVSHATMRNEDLIDSFTRELEKAMKEYKWQRQTSIVNAYGEYRQLIKEARRCNHDDEHATDVVSELFDALNDFAPPYTYFGAHEGDGSDYGFWPYVDCESLQDASECGYRVDISDHGNVTL